MLDRLNVSLPDIPQLIAGMFCSDKILIANSFSGFNIHMALCGIGLLFNFWVKEFLKIKNDLRILSININNIILSVID